MNITAFKVLTDCARSIALALLCGAAITACGDGTADVVANKPEKSAIITPKVTTTIPAPAAASITTSISGNPPAQTLHADSITLSWAAPTENTDGSALTDLSGYEIHYGTSASELTQEISIGTVGFSNYVVENLGSGTWYFEVVAVNALGITSAPSSLVTITI